MSNSKIKVAGYAKRELFGNGIEYRPFSPDLVGVQIASDGGTPLFTMGNFSITTNMDPKSDKNFVTNNFSNFTTLTDLDLTLINQNNLLRDKYGVILNLNNNNLDNYALFGSLSEFIRVSLENIITKWPASLFVNTTTFSTDGYIINGDTYNNYSYDSLSDSSSFRVNTTFINNKFQLNILKNGTILDTFNVSNTLRNVTVNYTNYSILFNNVEYNVVGFTGATSDINDYIYLKVKGDPFSGQLSTIEYHIKPNKINEEIFFSEIPKFEKYLLNRLITPKYTAEFNYSLKSDTGILLYSTESVTWPTSDGYNIDFDTTAYTDYAIKLVEISTNNDLYTSDLMNRFLVSESISSFDTAPVNLGYLDQDSTGQKMNKTLHIYGRNFDEINKYIKGISFSNVVTYDKQDNTPDIYLKNLASVLGWDLISSVVENGLLSSYVTSTKSTYSGHTVGLTAIEADTELWRRLILNSPWIWKSKGTRKSIEFILKFIGAPIGLLTFNEYIYKGDGPIDIDLFKKVLVLNGLDSDDLSIYPIDSDGYPSPLSDSSDMYFQNNGLWYRETGGSNATIDILTGNNPHLGPYDGGFKYINQFKSLIPNFSAVTITSETLTINSSNLYINNESGTFNKSVENSILDSVIFTSVNGRNISTCYDFNATVKIDPLPTEISNKCGCITGEIDKIMSLCIVQKEQNNSQSTICTDKMIKVTEDNENGVYIFDYYQYNPDGSIFPSGGEPIPNTSNYVTSGCCEYIGGIPMYTEMFENNVLVNAGYFCQIKGFVTNNIIIANNDMASTVNGSSGGQSLNNVLSNDTVNGSPATLNDVTLTQISTTNYNANINVLDGSVNVNSGSNGSYTIVYEICQIDNITNCATATVNGDIFTSVIVANNDSGNPVTGTTGGVSVSNVLVNDTLNGSQATLSNVTLTQISTTNNGVNLNVSNGSVNVNSGVPVGDYVVYYQICEIGNPTNCDTATVTVPVKPEDAPFVVEADYMVLTYEFTDGQDLDTRTRVITPIIGQTTTCEYVGWDKRNSFPINNTWSSTVIPTDYLVDWAGDNTGNGFESVLINLKQIRLNNPTQNELVVDCRAFWYTTKGNNPVNVKATFYLGGTMVKGTPATFKYTNTGYTSTFEYLATGVEVTELNTAFSQINGQRITTFNYNFTNNVGYFNNNDVSTPLPSACGIEYSFSTGTTASGSACFETEFPTLKYSHDAPLVVNSLIYNDKKETTLFNGGNLYYKLGDNSYRITANGVISEIYDCTTRTYPYCVGTTRYTSPTTRIYDSLLCGGNGSGGTCVLEGTDITLADGTTKKVEQLIIGDELKSKLVDSLTTDNVDTSDWNTNELILSDDIVTVTNNEPSNVTYVNSINDGLLVVTDSHIHLVKHNNTWSLKRTIELSVGDYLVDEFGTEIEIFSITILEGEFTVYDLGVEDNDLYIANGVLTHNK